MAKLDAKKLKQEFEALDDDDKQAVLTALGIEKDDDDPDLVKTVKKLVTRLDAIEERISASNKDKDRKDKDRDGFFASIFK